MKGIYYAPEAWQAAAGQSVVFLAGSIDLGAAPDWQKDLGATLAEAGYLVLNPRRPDWDASWSQEIDNAPFREQVEWELEGLERADKIVFYFAPASKSPVTLLELGLWARSGKCVVCCPDGFWRKGNIDIVCARYNVPQAESIEALAQLLIEK